jgi:hypothetical protein
MSEQERDQQIGWLNETLGVHQQGGGFFRDGDRPHYAEYLAQWAEQDDQAAPWATSPAALLGLEFHYAVEAFGLRVIGPAYFKQPAYRKRRKAPAFRRGDIRRAA